MNDAVGMKISVEALKNHLNNLSKLLEFGVLPDVKQEEEFFTFNPITKFLGGEMVMVA